MPGTRCAVATCNNSLVLTKKNDSTKHIVYHKFPNDIHRRKVWAFKCRREDKFNPMTSHVCSQHFNEHAYKRDLRSELLGIPNKKELLEDAIPTENLGLKGSQNCKSTERKSRVQRREERVIINNLIKKSSPSAIDNLTNEATNVQTNCDNMDRSPDNMIPKRDTVVFKRKPCCKCERLEKQNRTLRAHYSKLKIKEMKNEKKIKELKIEQAMKSVISTEEVKKLKRMKNDKRKKEEFKEKCTNILNDIFSPSQIKKLMGKKMVIWSADDLARAFTLRYLSRKAYMFLKNDLRYPLPGLSTLRRYASKLNLRQGILQDVLNIMKLAGSKKSNIEKICVITFDEMKISSQYEYDVKADQVVGKHSQMQVAMLRGLFSPWKQPVYIGFDTKMTKKLLLDIISKVHEAGYLIVSSVCDMGGGNMGLWREMGVSIHKNWFQHPIATDQIIYCFADAPHELKLIRNWLLDTGFLIDDTHVDKKPLELLLKLDNNEIKMCPKLKKIHLECHGPTRQNVKLASQLLSNTVSKALLYMLKTKSDVNFDDIRTKELSEFIATVDKWFDVFNSYTEKDIVETKMGFGLHLKKQIAAIDEMKDLITNMKCKGKNVLQLFQKGIIISIKSLKDLFFDMKNKFNIKFILTHRLNQDCLENFFSQVRSRGGLDDHPTPLNALYRIRMIILGKNPGILNDKGNTVDMSQDEFLANSILQKENQLGVAETAVNNETYLLSDILKKASIKTDIATSFISPLESFTRDLLYSNTSSVSVNVNPKNVPREIADPSLNSVRFGTSSLCSGEIGILKSVDNIVTQDGNEANEFSKLEENGLEYMSGFIAKKFYKKYANLDLRDSSQSDHCYQLPSWATILSYGGLIVPSSTFLKAMNSFETIFRNFLPNKVLSNEINIVKNISNSIHQEHETYPLDLIHSFVKLRIFIRMKYHNSIKPSKTDCGRKLGKKFKKIVN